MCEPERTDGGVRMVEVPTSTSYISWHNQSELWDNVCLLTKGKRLINGPIWPKNPNKEWCKLSLNIWSFFFFLLDFYWTEELWNAALPSDVSMHMTHTHRCVTFMFHRVCRSVRFTLDWLLVNHTLQTEQQISGLRRWQPTQHERDKQDVNTFIHSPVQALIHTLRRSGLDTFDLKPHSGNLMMKLWHLTHTSG